MRISTDDTDTDEDMDECPYCKAFIAGLADEVTDDHQVDVRKDVAGVKCPSCGNWIALVREHTYRISRLSNPPSSP
jgi:predicted RNA-binding Zn-ribbon protein involved in translation (DUF1610 family)